MAGRPTPPIKVRPLTGIGKIMIEWLVKGRIHYEDLERYGRSCPPDHARYLGDLIWREWRRRIEETGRHPSKRHLAAFLRGYAAMSGAWLPDGMAGYLAQRLDPEVPEPAKLGGRPPRRSADYRREAKRDLATAMVGLCCAGDPKGGDIDVPRLAGPDDDAVRCAAKKLGRAKISVYLAFRQYRYQAALGLLFPGDVLADRKPAAND